MRETSQDRSQVNRPKRKPAEQPHSSEVEGSDGLEKGSPGSKQKQRPKTKGDGLQEDMMACEAWDWDCHSMAACACSSGAMISYAALREKVVEVTR